MIEVTLVLRQVCLSGRVRLTRVMNEAMVAVHVIVSCCDVINVCLDQPCLNVVE